MSRADTLRALLVAAVCACTPKGATQTPSPALPTPQPQVAATEVSDELKPRLKRLEAALEAAREQYHVPGMAVAVVKDDGVVFAHGFGHADLEQKVKVDARTMFAIGSSTKAFTATLVGMLVDDGKMAWDDPIAKHVPEFVLAVRSDDKAAQATIRDALCHRTGFTRMGLLWASGTVPRKDFLAQSSKAEPMAKLGEKFLYNNVTYTAAGEATARVADTTWADLVRARLLKPLGMKDAIVTKDEVDASTSMAKGYRWRKDDKRFEPLPFRALDGIAPAGAINAHVLDMTKWLRFQLNRGRVARERLIEAETLQETWNTQMKIGGGVNYGLGWFIEDWNGKGVLHHGGNIDGFSAMVAMIPEEQLGFVMLTNVSYTPMQNAVRELVFDAMLGELAGDGPGEDLAPYTGAFVANFGPFTDTEFKVTVSSGKLFVDVPGQMNYELKPAGEDGRRPFAQTDQIAVSFEKSDDDKVQVMRLHQGGLDFELLRRGYVPAPEVPLAELAKFEGYFDNDKLGRSRVLVRNNRLAVDIPKQMVYELHRPDDEGMWRFRVKQDIAVSFAPRKGKPKTMTLHQGGKTFGFKRAPAPKGLPTVDKLLRRRKAAKAQKVLTKIGIVHMTGRVRAVQAGVIGKFDILVDADGRVAMTMDWGRFGSSRSVMGMDAGWEVSSFGPDEIVKGKLLEQGRLLHPFVLAGDWRRSFESTKVTGTSKVEGHEVFVVKVTHGELPTHTLKVDVKSGEVVEESVGLLWRGPGEIATTRSYSDYRNVLGLRLPFKASMKNEPQGEIVMEIAEVKRYEGGPAEAFPPSPK